MRLIRAIMLSITLLAVGVASVGFLLLSELRAVAAETNTPVELTIEEGATTSQIATRLRAEGLIRQPILFTALVRMRGLDGDLQSGNYVLSPDMKMSEIAAALQNSQAANVQVTIPEGLRLEEVGAIVAAGGLVSEADFLRTARNGDAFRDRYFLLRSMPPGSSLEGYLFPDTYRISTTATVTEVVTLMLDRFAERYAGIEREVQVPGVSVHDIVTMAAVVQREAALVEEMPTIAAVFWNRLQPEYAAETGGGRLQADATVQYALGYSVAEQTWWRRELTVDELRVDSPYNTRERPGLPPGPISNPGMAALQAAAQPDMSRPYLYFVASCARDGSHNFAVDFTTFQQYVAEWQACQ